jgi:D-alanyl-D-alanine carboxypeptidase/D-alanyl-D-alanine-endopeptidase (penicillin-binding protein 4)
MFRTGFFYIFLTTIMIIGASQALAQSKQNNDLNQGFNKLGRTLATLSANAPGNSRVSISVIDVATGTLIYKKSDTELMNPASNVKIITAACALKQLGGHFRFTTSLHGKRDGSIIRGPVYIKGHADPTLSTDVLWKMSRHLKAAGVRRVEGGIVVDDSYFDGNNLPYAYDQQKDEDHAFRSPVGAVSLNHNTLAITIRPAVQGMKPARLFLDPPGYAILVNDSVTMEGGANNPKISATAYENRTRIRVWGQVQLGNRPVTYYRRVDNPSLLAGHGLKAILESMGISGGGGVQTGPLPAGTLNLVEHRSKPLSTILYEAGKVSNNFVAETVLKTIGAESTKGAGTWENAIARVSTILIGWGLDDGSYVYRNGSGLFDANRFSADQFTKVLRGVYLDSKIRPEFVSQLAIGGIDGTIKSRYQKATAKGIVRAKTGTLEDVSAISGYVFDPSGKHPIAFSVLVNNAAGYVSSARAYQERIVTAIADFLQ